MPAITPAIAQPAAVAELKLNPAKATKAEDAAQQFESIFLAQMLRSARESAAGIGGEDESDSETSTMMEVAEQQLAQMLARQGGLGLAHIVTAGLARGKD